METYILKSIGCLLILYTFYRLFLENEKAHSFKRFFLIAILIISFTLPFITITYEAEVAPGYSLQQYLYQPDNTVEASEANSNFNFSKILWIVYIIGVLCFLVRFLKNILQLNYTIKNNPKEVNKYSTRVLLPFRTIPYSYFQYIFLEKERYLKGEIPTEVIQHEEAHVKQGHTIDLFVLEILQILFWFNPLIYFLKRSMRLNHEFLADDAVLKNQADPVSYSNLIINSSRELHQLSLTSPFKHSLIKKRIIMISNQFSGKLFFSKIGLLIPVLCLCIYFFNNDIVAKTIPHENVSKSEVFQQDYLFFIEVVGESIKLNGKEVRLQNFAEKLDNITQKYSEDDIRSKNFRLHLSNIPDDFAEKLNKEYKKSRYFNLNPSEDGLFPSTPPVPSKPEGQVPQPPKAPKPGEVEAPEVPDVPEAPKEPVRIEVREVPETPEAPDAPVVIEVRENQNLHEERMKIREEHLKKREKHIELREEKLEKRRLEFEERRRKILEKRRNNKDQNS
ncbi:hypothetical protein LB467_05955 [Salegentibacter sp. JZCK2]|uniref:M56 family metallopeptidase n=1 Tax=Salegentibacter tibetensis TaxID=2873600 RepID=UPI001CCDD98C|nr:M56 family metallopeptidase [Salegentibacter tibetensis]MBZ9729224.1 hypothetical protein [Salegentibacter tibetensis]